MKIKVIELNINNKIELTKQELEDMLNEAFADGYDRGYNLGRSHTWDIYSKWDWGKEPKVWLSTTSSGKENYDNGITITSENTIPTYLKSEDK